MHELSSEACLPLLAPRQGSQESNSFLRRKTTAAIPSFFCTFSLVMHTPLREAGTI